MSEDKTKTEGKVTKKKGKGLTRRKFLVGAGASVAGALVMNQMAPRELKAVEPPKKWDKETEVLIVGTGYAGLAAAIEAFDGGSKVTVIEKSPVIGGNSAIASGAYNAVDPGRQGKQDIKDSIDLHYKQTLGGGDLSGRPGESQIHGRKCLGWASVA